MPISNLRGLYQNLRDRVTVETNESIPTVYFNDTHTNTTVTSQPELTYYNDVLPVTLRSPSYGIEYPTLTGISASLENSMYGITAQQSARDIGSNSIFYKGEALDVVLTGLLQTIEELKVDNKRLKLAYEEMLDEALKEQI